MGRSERPARCDPAGPEKHVSYSTAPEAVGGDGAAAELTTGTSEHTAWHVPAGGAECDADPDLASTTPHGHGDQRVQTGR